MLNRKLTLIISPIIISSCATINKPNYDIQRYGENNPHLKRAQELYSCSEYFKISGIIRSHRKDAKDYYELYETSKDLGSKLIAYADKDIKSRDFQLEEKFTEQGVLNAIEMIKEIGKDRTNKKLDEITLNCYKNTKKEELFFPLLGVNKELATIESENKEQRQKELLTVNYKQELEKAKLDTPKQLEKRKLLTGKWIACSHRTSLGEIIKFTEDGRFNRYYKQFPSLTCKGNPIGGYGLEPNPDSAPYHSSAGYYYVGDLISKDKNGSTYQLNLVNQPKNSSISTDNSPLYFTTIRVNKNSILLASPTEENQGLSENNRNQTLDQEKYTFYKIEN